jgi:two-component system, NarL family, nitrate/nitrite response regulator NarL
VNTISENDAPHKSPCHQDDEKSAGRRVRILVADDQEGVRKRVIATLMSHGGYEVCGEASTGTDAVRKAKELAPDLIVLDITMPEMNGLDAAGLIRSFAPRMPILILSVHKSKQLMEEARKLGVRGYVTKGEAVQKLVRAVGAVLQDQPYFPEDL